MYPSDGVTVCPFYRMMVLPYDGFMYYGVTVCPCYRMIVLPYDGVTVRWNAVRWYSSILDIV